MITLEELTQELCLPLRYQHSYQQLTAKLPVSQ
jgi:hypothetical protein